MFRSLFHKCPPKRVVLCEGSESLGVSFPPLNTSDLKAYCQHLNIYPTTDALFCLFVVGSQVQSQALFSIFPKTTVIGNLLVEIIFVILRSSSCLKEMNQKYFFFNQETYFGSLLCAFSFAGQVQASKVLGSGSENIVVQIQIHPFTT